MRNSLESLTCNLRYKFGMKIAGEVKTNPKAFWRYANSKIKVKASIPTLADESLDSMEATSDEDKEKF